MKTMRTLFLTFGPSDLAGVVRHELSVIVGLLGTLALPLSAMRFVAAVFAVVALTAGPAAADGPPDCLTPTQTSPPQTILGDWNCAALVEVRASKSLRNGPPVVARALAIAHTCMYDAWAAYDDVAVGTVLGGSLRRPDDHASPDPPYLHQDRRR